MASIAREALKKIVIPATSRHTATVILVHGLGDTGHGLKPLADIFRQDPALGHVKWVLPHSPHQAVTANMGIVMPSWFDIYSFGFNTVEDENGMLASARQINELVTEEIEAGIEPDRIVLGGFSQGGTMSLLTGLTGGRSLGGLIVLSGWLPLRNKFKALASSNAKSTPIFWGHGSEDPLVKAEFSKSSKDFLISELGFPVSTDAAVARGLDYHVYGGLGHSTSPKELKDIQAWLIKAVADPN